MEDWLTTYEAVRISGYELDYIRKLVLQCKVRQLEQFYGQYRLKNTSFESIFQPKCG